MSFKFNFYSSVIYNIRGALFDKQFTVSTPKRRSVGIPGEACRYVALRGNSRDIFYD